MHRNERFEGSGAPFEGDRTIWVRSIPAGAQLHSAVLTLTPAWAPGAPLFEEMVNFSASAGSLGATQSRGSDNSGALHWTELDFHQRRTVTRIAGSGLTGAEVQVDLGGLYVRLNKWGAPLAPGESDTLTLAADGALPGLTASKFKLTSGHVMPVSLVTLRSTPSNLLIRPVSGPAFWSRPGELVSPVSTADVATAVQEALATAEVDGGFCQLPLIIHSDTLCRLDIELATEFTVAQLVLPGALTEMTLTYDYAGAPAAPAVTLTVPAASHLVPTAARARAVGSFQVTRVGYGPVGPVVPSGSLALTAGQSLAAPVMAASDLAVTAVDLLLAATTPTARLQLNIVADIDGKPWNQPLLGRPTEVAVERGDDPAPRWISAALPEAFTFTAGTRYWLILQAESGEAAWSVTAAAASPATQQTRDGGLSWRQAVAPGVAQADALLRLRTVPNAFTMPIQLEVGAGTSARRIRLDRFAPLGRVEVDLNSPEIIEGVNSAITAMAAGSCPTGEHVRNGDFSAWTRSADQPTGSRTLDAGFQTRRITVANSCTAFVAGGTTLATVASSAANVLFRVAAVDVFADRVTRPIGSLGLGRVLSGLTSDPSGRYCYLLADGNTVLTLDNQTGLTTRATLAPADRSIAAACVVSSADGQTLYAAATYTEAASAGDSPAEHVLVAIDAGAVRTNGAQVWGAEVALASAPIDLVRTANGAELWVLCSDGNGSAALVRVDVGRLAVAGAPITVPGTAAVRLAISASGSVIAVVHRAPSAGHPAAVSPPMLSVIDTAAHALVGQLRLTEGGGHPQPLAVAVSPDGRYAFVTLPEVTAVALVDLAQLRMLRRITFSTEPSDCVVTPDGERVYVANAEPVGDDSAGNAFTVLTIGALLPEDWVVTAGTMRPACASSGGRIAMIGAQPQETAEPAATATAALAQVVAVSGGCRYELTFAALATGEGATVELHWRRQACSQSRTDTVPITAQEPFVPRTAQAPSLLPHRMLADAPADAVQVELRIQAPPGVAAFVDDVSLHATSSVLPNGDLLVHGDLLDGWQVTPTSPSGFRATTADGELVLRNDGSIMVTVAQQADVSAGQAYQLTVDASSPADGPLVDLVWTAAGQPTGTAVPVPVTAGASRPLRRSVSAPAGADAAEARLVLPPGAEMHLRRVSLDAVATTQLPLMFVAESPGELTVLNWQVAYDVDETPRVPPLPAGGLCRPGRPEPVPGEVSGDCCYCATCQGVHNMTDPQPTMTAAGVLGTALTCTNCGAGVTLPGVITAPGPASGPVVVTSAPGVDIGRLLRPPLPPERLIPLDAVKGIGTATVKRLNALGIVSIADLAAASLDQLTAIPYVSDAAARSWIEQARTLARLGNADDAVGGQQQ